MIFGKRSGIIYGASVNGQNGFEQKKHSYMKLAAVVVVILSVTAFCLVMYFQAYPIIEQVNRPNSGEFNAVERYLQEGGRTDLASPDKRSWNGGDNGIFQLVIINRYSTEETFYINIFLEGLGGELEDTPVGSLSESANQWFNYPDRLTLESGEKEVITISMSIPEDALKGSYKFRVLVCDGANCALKTGNMYDSSSISLYVNG